MTTASEKPATRLVLPGGNAKLLPEWNQTRTPIGTAASRQPRELPPGQLGEGAGALPAEEEEGSFMRR